MEAVLLKKSLQALGRQFDLEGGVTAQVGSPLEIGGGFTVDLVKKEIIDLSMPRGREPRRCSRWTSS